MEVLRAENLYKTYGTGDNAVEALKNVSFSVKRGEGSQTRKAHRICKQAFFCRIS